MAARHHEDGEGKEGDKEEHQEQGGDAGPASLLLLVRPQVRARVTAARAHGNKPLREGN